MKCNKCGAEIVDGGKFCQNCGKNNDFFYYFNRIIISIVVVLVLVIIISFSMFDRMLEKESEENVSYSSVSNQEINSIVKRYNISFEVQQEIIKNWNKVSGYGTANLNRVILDVTRGWMYLTYTDTLNNGLYVYSDATSGAHFGNEYDKSTGLTYREQKENMYSIFLSTWPEQYKKLTKDEFIKLLDELK